MFKQYPAYKFVLAGCDYLLLLAAWVAAVSIRFYGVPWGELLSRPLVRTQAALVIVYSLVWVVIFQHFNLYKLDYFMSFGRQVISIFKSLLYGLIGLVIITFVFKRLDFVESRIVLGLFVLFSLVGVVLFRTLVFRPLFAFASQKKIIRRKVLIVGRDRTAKMVAAQIDLDESHGFDVIGFVNDETPVGERVFEDLINLGSMDDLDHLVRANEIKEVIIAESSSPQGTL